MKEIWVTQREGQAIEHVLLPLAEYDAVCVIVEAARAYTEVRGLDAQRNAYLKLVMALGKEKLGGEQEYDDGPWASTGTDPCVDVAGYWHFPEPDVSDKAGVKAPIMIVPLKEGYVVENGEFKVNEAALTDAEDLAEWLLGWLGFDEDMYYLAANREELVRVAKSAHGIHADLAHPAPSEALSDKEGHMLRGTLNEEQRQQLRLAVLDAEAEAKAEKARVAESNPDVLELAAAGKKPKEIAKELGIALPKVLQALREQS